MEIHAPVKRALDLNVKARVKLDGSGVDVAWTSSFITMHSAQRQFPHSGSTGAEEAGHIGTSDRPGRGSAATGRPSDGWLILAALQAFPDRRYSLDAPGDAAAVTFRLCSSP